MSKYNPLAGTSYIKLSKELDHPRKGSINISNANNNECSKWCLAIYLNPTDHDPKRILNADNDFEKGFDFKDIKFPVKIRNIDKIEKKISVFGYENKKKYPIDVLKKCLEEKHVDLLLIGEGEKKYYVLIDDFNRFIKDNSLQREKKTHFYRYCLNSFITEEILKRYIKDFFKIND